MKTWHFEKEIVIRHSLERVFGFFSKAENLNKITPKKFNFQFITPLPIIIQQGTIIDYKLNIYNIPVHWRTEISVWQPPHRFVDVQVKGPYRKWIHEHLFAAVPEGTRMIDSIQYSLYGGIMTPLLNKILVRRDIQNIFNFRQKKLASLFSENG